VEELVAALHALAQGLWVADPTLARFSQQPAPGEDQPNSESLTERESEVLQLLAHGLANKQIAALLGISEHTVKFHVSSIYNRLGVSNRAEAVRKGIQQGLVVL
jgi:DNA-binding NarL/FixJ family response regulator